MKVALTQLPFSLQTQHQPIPCATTSFTQYSFERKTSLNNWLIWMDHSLLGSLTQFNLYTGTNSCMQYCCGSGSGLRWQWCGSGGIPDDRFRRLSQCYLPDMYLLLYPTILLLSVNSWRTDSSIYISSMRRRLFQTAETAVLNRFLRRGFVYIRQTDSLLCVGQWSLTHYSVSEIKITFCID